MKIDFKKLIIGVLVFSVLLAAFSLAYYYVYFLPQKEIKQIELERQKQEQLEEQLEKEREEEILTRKQYVKELKSQYREVLSQVYTSEEDIARLNVMTLVELEEAFNKYQEWEMQRQQQQITEWTEQMGIPAPFVEQIQRAYPEEEWPARLIGLKAYMNLLETDSSAEAMEDFMRFLFPPELREEP